MARIISIHSFRGGTGKSNTTANLAALLASDGLRVGVVDTDIQSPGIHILFGQDSSSVEYSLNDFLWNRCDIEATAIDVTENLSVPLSGRVFLIPSSMKAGEIARVLREGYEPEILANGLRRLTAAYNLDVLLIDTHPGLNEETLLSMALSHALVIVMRPDQQDYEGTGVTVQVARALNVPRMLLLVNKVPAVYDAADVEARVRDTYQCEVAGVILHSDELMALGSGEVFVLRYPDHPVSQQWRGLAQRLLQ